MLARIPDPAPLGRGTEQLLGHRDTEELGIAQPWFSARQVITRPTQYGQDTVLKIDVECGQKGIQVVLHKITLGALRPSPGPPRHNNPLGLTHLGVRA
jgi:hypothetical protein